MKLVTRSFFPRELIELIAITLVQIRISMRQHVILSAVRDIPDEKKYIRCIDISKSEN